MRRPRFIIIDGKPYLWRDILELRRAQCAEPKEAKATLFPLRDHACLATARTVTGRYCEPSLSDQITTA